MNWPPKVVLSNFRGFFVFLRSRKWSQRRFLIFPRGGKPFFADFWFSLAGESRFLLISDFPPWRKAVFRWFLIFPREGKPIFADFWFSLVEDSWFSLIFVRRTPTKRDFSYFSLIVGVRSLVLCVFHQSYPYESFFFLFFDDCTPYLNKFSRKLIIYPRIWVIFLENRWLYPVSEQIFLKMTDRFFA